MGTPVLCAIFAALLHSLFVPHIVVTMPQNWLGLGHAAFVPSHGWTVVNPVLGHMCFLPQCGAQTVSAALPQKTHGETPALCAEVMIYHSPTMIAAQNCMAKTEPVLGQCAPQCGAQIVSAAMPQKTHGETPALCVIMIYHSPTMTAAQKLHGQDRASFGAQWPQCGAQTLWSAQKTGSVLTMQFCVQFVPHIVVTSSKTGSPCVFYHSPTMTLLHGLGFGHAKKTLW